MHLIRQTIETIAAKRDALNGIIAQLEKYLEEFPEGESNPSANHSPVRNEVAAGLVNERFDWTAVDWSKKDKQLATELGCSVSTVWQRRKQLAPKAEPANASTPTETHPKDETHTKESPRGGNSFGNLERGSALFKALHRAIAVLPSEFSRDDITAKLTELEGERTVKGWTQSGSVPATLLTMRDSGMIELIRRDQGMSINKRGARWENPVP